MTTAVKPEVAAHRLLGDIRVLIDHARTRVSQAVNAGMVMLYWHIGHRVRTALLNQERAEYGQRVVDTLAQKLTGEYGKGFTKANLFHMIRFAEVFADEQIVYALCRQVSWSHFREIMYLKDGLKRDFYAEMCRIERWSTRTLRAKVDGMLDERTALAKKSEEVIKDELAALREEDRLTPDLVFRDTYVLDFLNRAYNR